MSEENVRIVRAAIDAANRGDWDAVFEGTAPNFVWDNSRAIGADNRAVLSAAEPREFFKRVTELWESVAIELTELVPAGDHLVVPHITHVRGRDGIEAHARTTWLITIRMGRIERVCLYQDKEEALEAAGLRE